MSTKDTGKTYARSATGDALGTVKEHPMSPPQDIVLFGACFCPFVQRAWVALEALGIPYNLDIYQSPKPQELLEVSPKGLVPALKLQQYQPARALNESTVIMEYLEDLAATTTQKSLMPPKSNPYARALVRLMSDAVNRALVPSFYKYLQAQDPEAQVQDGTEFHEAIAQLVALLQRAETEIVGGDGSAGPGEAQALGAGLGLWIDTNDALGWVDILAGPWLYRATNVLTHYRGLELPASPRFHAYLNRLFSHTDFKKTCSTEGLYLDSYERYAFNRPNTSQVADAINAGRTLP
ncbi:hypothetical protein CYLTODRAFT_416694 [Cylindrobasidium torrendii FP15055 ss-10]|uniref:Glutathione S-transferase n=1 Tax=Cylindrobasidium torrendii FP15055 ss-10 TaxID=1314674 RepID=A0A0D7BU07_9AGAR|nr:hypothetical protein CYLTODRAFT_416694 [Cylindrobasidium torrendii FP15055 ss-10]